MSGILAAGSAAHASFLVDILVVLVAARLAAELAERVRLPAVVGEILAGVALGPSALGLIDGGEVVAVLGELGVILLLLQVGMELDLVGLRSVGRTSLVVALVGVALPLGLGAAFMTLLGDGGVVAVFTGAALTATSVGITARVFADLRALGSVESRTVLGAAVADDVLGLLLLTVVTRAAEGGAMSALSIAAVAALAISFLVVAGLLGLIATPRAFRAVAVHSRSNGAIVVLAMAFTLGFAHLAGLAGLAPVIGAFVAGLALGRTDQSTRIHRELGGVAHLLIPVFFLQIGTQADVTRFADPRVLALAGGLLVVAILGKVATALVVPRRGGNRLVVGVGMLPRGEVGLIFAGLGLEAGVLSGDLYAAVLMVVLGTTLAAPPLLRMLLASQRSVLAGAVPGMAEDTCGRAGVAVSDGVVSLAVTPRPTDALKVALHAAVLAATARPSEELAEWISGAARGPLRWDDAAAEAFRRLLREGNERSWRLLNMLGVLERALPEVAAVIERRHDELHELDPAHALTWQTLMRARAELERIPVADPDAVLIAALALDMAGALDAQTPVSLVRQLAKRLRSKSDTESLATALAREPTLLAARAQRLDGLDEEPTLQLAAHLSDRSRVDAFAVIGLATLDMGEWGAERLDVLRRQISLALQRLDLTGPGAQSIVATRVGIAERLVAAEEVADRIRRGPRAWVLAHPPPRLAEQAALATPRPGRLDVRLRVSTAGDGTSVVDVAAADRPGLLASMAAVLALWRLDVLSATSVTWGDGAALTSFTVEGPRPSERALRNAIADALVDPRPLVAVPDAIVTFDDVASPWYSLCEIEAVDRRGLLAAVGGAFAACGATVRSARVISAEGRAVDVFELTDASGSKLSERAKVAIATAIATGQAPKRRWYERAHKPGTQPKHSPNHQEINPPYGQRERTTESAQP